MARTVVGYIPGGLNAINAAASQSPTGAIDPVTLLPFPTGINVGIFYELSDGEAKAYSKIDSTHKQLYSGIYAWVQLDPAVTGSAIAVGTALWWLQGMNTFQVTTVASGNAPDFAGVSIDPNFGPSSLTTGGPYAYIQLTPGKATALFQASITNGAPAYGDQIGLSSFSLGTFNDYQADTGTTAISPLLQLGYALAAPASSTASLVRLTRAQSRF
jgi:hypothetical protein